ncbi:MAG TPA: TonB C-terminal domain-containing protein [Kofleriaceae bacterium]|jgi:HEAT repeat protein
MRAAIALALATAAGCAGASSGRLAPPLAPPDALDMRTPGAAYLSAVASRLQPGWSEFLNDCRHRLAASHPLNAMTLAASIELVIAADGHVASSKIAVPSGNADFDRAVTDLVADTSSLDAPPRELLSDDDLVHVRWLFARDRRQAGPATAQLERVQLPLGRVVPRLVAAGELPRAARRIADAPQGSARTDATRRLMIAVLAEALTGADEPVRHDALVAIARAHAYELAPKVRELIVDTVDADLRAEAIATAAALGDADSVPRLLADLAGALVGQPSIALADARALISLARGPDAAAVIASALSNATTAPAVLAFAIAPTPSRVPDLAALFRRANAPTRAALCGALAAAPAGFSTLAAGLRDRDATVRASCAEAAGSIGHDGGWFVPRLAELLRDRDRSVRARAIAAIAAIDASKLPVVEDDAPIVRAAYATALAAIPARAAALHTLAGDRDPDVRAAAWRALASLPAGAVAESDAELAAADAALQVRLASVPALADDATLQRLEGDASPELRTAALVRLVQHRGRATSEPELLERLAVAPPASADRVRIALAWLLAG